MKLVPAKSILILMVMAASAMPTTATSTVNTIVKDNRIADEIYKGTYHYQFQKVDSLIGKNDGLLHASLEYNLAVVNYYWWKLISGECNGKYTDLVSERIERIENQNPFQNGSIVEDKLFMLISIFAYKARVNLLDYSYIAALSSLSNYYSLLKNSFGLEAKYHPFYLTSGLYLFFSGLAKEKTPFLTPILNHYYPGNMEAGLSFLKLAAASEDWKISQEAQYFLMKINFDVYRNYVESARYCNILLAKYPENLLFQQYIFRISLALGQVVNAKTRIMLMEKTVRTNKQLTSDEKVYLIKQAKKEYQKKTGLAI